MIPWIPDLDAAWSRIGAAGKKRRATQCHSFDNSSIGVSWGDFLAFSGPTRAAGRHGVAKQDDTVRGAVSGLPLRPPAGPGKPPRPAERR